MKKIYALALLSLLLVPLGLRAQTGTKGNTITFDNTNCTQLKANISATWFSFLRHNQAPIQILNANPTANSNTIAPLNEADGNGIFATGDATIANNMAFSGSGHLEFYNNYANYNALCFAVIAPKGYRFTEYYMDIRSTKASDALANNSGASGAVITRYTYNPGSTYQYTLADGESMTLSGKNSEIYTHTLSNAGNILYFKVTFAQTNTQSCINMNEFRLTYVIDTPFDATIPNKDNKNQVGTGILNLGQFTGSTGSKVFTKANITDLEDIHIVAEDGTTQMSVSNGVIEVPAGTYWIESPAKFRFTGAKLNFQLAEGSSETTYESTTTLESGKNYKIGDGSGNYISLNNNGNAINTTDQSSATVWTITQVSNGYTISTIRNSTRYYLYSSGSGGTVSISTNSFTWTYNNNDRTFRYQGTLRQYGLRYNANAWNASRTDRNTPTSITFYKETTTSSGTEAYTATLYGTSASASVGSADLSASKTSASLSANNLNNDGVKFTVTGPAAFTVDLTLEPLDPNVQTLEVGYLPNNAEVKPNNSVDNVSVTSSNFEFNNGEVIAVPIRPEDDQVSGATHQIVFRNAYNESRINWYDGTATGLSNYYLIDSYYEGGDLVTSDAAPYAKVDANQAGTTKIEFSNIKTLTQNGGYLTEIEYTQNATVGTNQWNKNSAGFQEIKLADNVEKTVYIYTADEPLYRIMTEAGKNQNKHAAYTFYTAKVKPIKVNETPVVEVTPIYTETFKGDNTKVPVYNAAMKKSVTINKDTELDTDHTFYGVTVTSVSDVEGVEPSGYLTGEAIVEAIRTAMTSAEKTYGATDPFRTLLYVDMSSLKSISGDENTWKEIMLGSADNCLFFMPSNFAISQSMVGGGIIAGGDNGVAVTDITIIDQQPFYTPHNFRTSTHLANYTRKVTPVAGHEDATTVTVVLPFDVNLSADGHLKTASDAVDQSVQFFKLSDNIEKNKNNDKIYDVVLSNVTMGRATAGTPYIVKTDNSVTSGTVFGVSILGANFANGSNIAALSGQDDSFTSKGTFSGTVVRGEEIFYFSKDYFWNSKTLTDNYVNIRPFRAWYKTSNSTINALARFGLLWDEEISGVSEMLTTASATGVVYDIQGRVVSSNGLTSLPKGLYIMNGKKIFVK